MVPHSDHYHKWYFQEDLSMHQQSMKGFDLLIGEEHEAAKDLILSKVELCTYGSKGQGSRE